MRSTVHLVVHPSGERWIPTSARRARLRTAASRAKSTPTSGARALAPSFTVAASHEVGERALDLWARRPVVLAPPWWISARHLGARFPRAGYRIADASSSRGRRPSTRARSQRASTASARRRALRLEALRRLGEDDPHPPLRHPRGEPSRCEQRPSRRFEPTGPPRRQPLLRLPLRQGCARAHHAHRRGDRARAGARAASCSQWMTRAHAGRARNQGSAESTASQGSNRALRLALDDPTDS